MNQLKLLFFSQNVLRNHHIISTTTKITNQNYFFEVAIDKLKKNPNKKTFFSEHEDGRRGGEIARTVLWNSEFSLKKLIIFMFIFIACVCGSKEENVEKSVPNKFLKTTKRFNQQN